MDEELLQKIGIFLESGGVFASEVTLPENYLCEVPSTPTCEHCGAPMDRVELADEQRLICQGQASHERPLRKADRAEYRLDTQTVLREICSTLDLTPTGISESPLPKYALANTESSGRVALACDPQYYDDTLDALFTDSVRNQRINAVFTPSKLEGKVWERAVVYPVGSLAPPFPLEMLSDPEAVKEIIQSAKYTQNRSEQALSTLQMEDGLYEVLNQNPRLIQSELAYTRIFRETEFGGNLGDRLESVCKAAFMAMDMPLLTEFGGKSGNNETDIAAKLPEPTRLSGKPILALVDTKSNAEADISQEDIIDKHETYLRQANAPTFDDHHVTHMFVVYSMQGATANEVKWYDGIRKAMNEEDRYGSDTTMVVIFAGALSQLVDAHLSISQRNQLNLSIESLHDIIHPLFNYRLFKRQLPPDLRQMTRRESDEAYQEEYTAREQLLVITPEMVDAYLREVQTDEELDFIKRDLEAYPSNWY